MSGRVRALVQTARVSVNRKTNFAPLGGEAVPPEPGSAGRLRRDGGRLLRRAITGARLLRNGLENVAFTWWQL